MALDSLAGTPVSFLGHFIEPALRSIVLALAAGAVLFALRLTGNVTDHVTGVSPRLAVWRIVLVAALVMPLLSAALPEIPFSARFLNSSSFLRDKVAPLFTMSRADSRNAARSAAPSATSDVQTIAQTETAVTVAHFSPQLSDVMVAPTSAPHSAAAATVRTSRADRHTLAIASAYAAGSASASSDAIASVDEARYSHSSAQPQSELIPAPAVPLLTKLWRRVEIPTVLAAAYLAVLLGFLTRMAVGLALGHRLSRRATPIDDASARARLKSSARALQLKSLPRIAESEALSVPVTFGVITPSILLPHSWREWTDEEFTSVLLHELSHIERRDALTERLSLVHRAIFWFSPLSWWLHRQLSELAELASDEAALASGIDRTRYAETLLSFFTALETTPGRVWWQGVSMAASGNAERRVDRILGWTGETSMHLKKPVIVIAVCAAMPLVALASALTPHLERTLIYDYEPRAFSQGSSQTPSSSQSQQSQQTPPAPAAAPSAQTPAAAAVVPDIPEGAAVVPDAAVAPVAPKHDVYIYSTPSVQPMPAPQAMKMYATPAARVFVAPAPYAKGAVATKMYVSPVPRIYAKNSYAPFAVIAPRGRYSYSSPNSLVFMNRQFDHQNSITITDDGDGDDFVVVSGDTSYGVLSSKSPLVADGGPDTEIAATLRKTIGGDFIWYRHEGKTYIVRDPETIRQAKQAYAQVQALGQQQSALGEKQAELGKQQAELGQLMSQAYMNLPDVSAQMKQLQSQIDAMNTDANRKAMAEAQKNLEAAIAKMDVNSPDMSAAIAKLEAETATLNSGDMQEKMNQLQEQLGELQAKIGEAQASGAGSNEKLAEMESKLGEKESALGEQEGKLGEQEAAASKAADAQLRKLLNDAIAKGLAKPQ